MATRATMKKRLKQEGIEFLLVQFVDITGAAKVKMVPVSSLDDAVTEGAGFAGAAVWGLGQGPHSHDMLARIDLDSYARLAWQPNTVRFASDLFVDGESYPYCARTNLKRVLDAAKKKGYVFNVGMEPEHFLVSRNADGSIRPWDPDNVDSLAKPCYDFRSMAPAMAYLQDLTQALNALGWGVYQCDHEDANGQYEVNFDYADALTSSDRIIFFKMATSQLAKKYGAIATHMPKPFADRTGSGLHVHYHLADAKTGKNLFVDTKDTRGLGCSKLAYHFIGGILHHARALCAVASPTVNCYKRLQLGSGLYSSRSGFTWTPAFITYGDNNRTQMIRTAGLDGIERKLEPGEPNLGNMYERSLEDIRKAGIGILPQSLTEAIEALRQDEVIQSALGPIAPEFIAMKANEWAIYDHQISRWEIDQYLTSF